MASNKKAKLTPLQQEWKHQLSLLKRRVKSWEQKFKAVIEIPQEMPKRVTRQAIERLKEMNWRKLDEKRKEEAKREYTRRYDEEVIKPDIPEEPYHPPSEDDDWFKDEGYNTPDYNEPVDFAREVDAYLADFMTYLVENDNIETAEILIGLLNSSRARHGDEAFYDLITQPDMITNLNTLASVALRYSSDAKGRAGQVRDEAINKFATALNDYRPLNQTQSETLKWEGYVDYDFSDDW